MKLDQPIVEIQATKAMANTLHICWMLHNQCNHKCSYCHEVNYGGSHKWLKYEQVISFFEQVFAHYEKYNKKYLISFTGGEPTIWPDFMRLCEYLNERGCQIGMTTNGTRHPDFFRRLKDKFSFVAMSYHPEFTKDEVFLQNVGILGNNTNLGVRVMMHREKKYWDRSVALIEKIKNLPDEPAFTIEHVPILDDFGTSNPVPGKYEAWQQDFFAANPDFFHWKEGKTYNWPVSSINDADVIYADGSREELHPNEILRAELARFKGWDCRVGLDQLFINERGEVWRAGCLEGGKLAHIFDEGIKFPAGSVRCSKNYCHCTTDIMTSKSAPNAKSPWLSRLPEFASSVRS